MNKQKVTVIRLDLPDNLLKNSDFSNGFAEWVTDDKGDPANCVISPPGVRLVNQASIKQAATVEAKAKQYTFRISAGSFGAPATASNTLDSLGQVVIREDGTQVNSFYLNSGVSSYTLEHTTQSSTTRLEIEISSGGSTPVTLWRISLFDDFPEADEFIKDTHFKRPYIDWTGGVSDWQHGGVQLSGNGSNVQQLIRRLEPDVDYVITYEVLPYINESGQEEDIAVGDISGDGGFPYTEIKPTSPVGPIDFTARQNTLTLRLAGARIRFGSISMKKA
ncbi:DUF642 domain-containing protein [Pseudomonas putida]|jgi:hypothetical protein|nr:DUF642 domain-containing protein [Pseudomonas putida]